MRKYLRVAGAISSNSQEQLASLTSAITGAAYDAIKTQIEDRNCKQDGRLALDWLKLTVYAEKRTPVFNVEGDMALQTLTALLPAPAAPAPAITVEPAPAAAPNTSR